MTGQHPQVVGYGALDDIAMAQFVEPSPVSAVSRAESSYERWGKPVFDRVVAGMLLVVALPLILVIAGAVLLALGRPIFFHQARVGRHGRTFGMLKFRTMAPDRRQESVDLPVEQDRRERHKTADDPRHTRVGRFLRRLSLDELPQLWNVLRGDMSLVGPRPELTSVVAHYEPWQHQRHEVKPGITGLWQVTDRQSSDGDMHLHTATDLAYLGTMSLRTDLLILILTPMALAKGR